MADENIISREEFERTKAALISSGIVEEVEPNTPRITELGFWALQALAYIDPDLYAHAGLGAITEAAQERMAEFSERLARALSAPNN